MSQSSEFSDSETYPFNLSENNNGSQASSQHSKLVCSEGDNFDEEYAEINQVMQEPLTEQPKRGFVPSNQKSRGTRRKRKEINYWEAENDDKLSSSEAYSEAEQQKEPKKANKKVREPKTRGRGGRPRGRARRKEPEIDPTPSKILKTQDIDDLENENEPSVDFLLDFHNEIWYLCNEGGELILCDKCPKAFHQECTKNPVDYSKQWEWDYWSGWLEQIWNAWGQIWDFNDTKAKGNKRAFLQWHVCNCLVHFKWCDVPFLLTINAPYYVNEPQEEKNRLIKLFQENSLSAQDKIYRLWNYWQEARGVENIIESIKTENIDSEFIILNEESSLEVSADSISANSQSKQNITNSQQSNNEYWSWYYLVKFKGKFIDFIYFRNFISSFPMDRWDYSWMNK